MSGFRVMSHIAVSVLMTAHRLPLFTNWAHKGPEWPVYSSLLLGKLESSFIILRPPSDTTCYYSASFCFYTNTPPVFFTGMALGTLKGGSMLQDRFGKNVCVPCVCIRIVKDAISPYTLGSRWWWSWLLLKNVYILYDISVTRCALSRSTTVCFYMTLFVCCNDYMSFMFYTTFRENPVQGRIQGKGVKSTPSPFLGNPKISWRGKQKKF